MIPLSQYVFIGIAVYLLYRFIFNFLLPVIRTTRQVRRQFRDMHDAMNNQGNPFRQGNSYQQTNPYQQQDPHQQQPYQQQQPQKTAGDKMGEYIDFEEIK